jgi:hypothetical protein
MRSSVASASRPGPDRTPGTQCRCLWAANYRSLTATRVHEAGYASMSRQVKDELDWADFQVRSDVAVRRHQALVNCAFCFCWAAWFAHPASPAAPSPASGAETERGGPRPARLPGPPCWPRAIQGVRAWLSHGSRCGAGGVHGRTCLAPAAARPNDIPRGRPRPAPPHPESTNYR